MKDHDVRSQRHFTMAFLVLVSTGILVQGGECQNSNKEGEVAFLEAIMSDVRESRQVEQMDDLRVMDPQALIDGLEVYYRDPSAEVREFALSLACQTAMHQSDQALRGKVVERLLDGSMDSDPLVWQHSARNLLNFEASDFSEGAKRVIHELLEKKTPLPEIARAAGLAEMREEMPRLRALLALEANSGGREYGSVGWSARLARARLGSVADAKHAIRVLEKEPNPVIRVTVLLRDIAYVRQRRSVEAIRTYLDSEERLPSTKVTTPGVPVAQHALDLLVGSIRAFPISRKSPGEYSEDEIQTARKWMRTPDNWVGNIRR